MDAPTLTDALAAFERGDADAYGHAFAMLYGEMHAIARRQRRRWPGEVTLGTTALVHEAFLKLGAAEHLEFDGRSHFLGVAARAMRHLLCNHARDRRRLKRGGALRRTDADVDALPGDVADADLETLIALDDALRRLESIDPRQARVVECRFFGGLSIPDTAAALGTSPATVKRDWARARDWLHEQVMTSRSLES